MDIASLIIGITSILISLFSFFGSGLICVFSIILGIFGFCVGYFVYKEKDHTTNATVGMITSLCGFCFGFVLFALYIDKTSQSFFNILSTFVQNVEL